MGSNIIKISENITSDQAKEKTYFNWAKEDCWKVLISESESFRRKRNRNSVKYIGVGSSKVSNRPIRMSTLQIHTTMEDVLENFME